MAPRRAAPGHPLADPPAAQLDHSAAQAVVLVAQAEVLVAQAEAVVYQKLSDAPANPWFAGAKSAEHRS